MILNARKYFSDENGTYSFVRKFPRNKSERVMERWAGNKDAKGWMDGWNADHLSSHRFSNYCGTSAHVVARYLFLYKFRLIRRICVALYGVNNDEVIVVSQVAVGYSLQSDFFVLEFDWFFVCCCSVMG